MSADGATFEMHALVQLATRTWLEAHGHLEKWRNRYIENLNAAFPKPDYKNWTTCRAFLPHVKSVEARVVTSKRSLRPWSYILHNVAEYAKQMGEYSEAERLYKIECMISLDFPPINNEVEYEVLLVGLRLVWELETSYLSF